MGKVIVIKGADFSQYAVDVIDPKTQREVNIVSEGIVSTTEAISKGTNTWISGGSGFYRVAIDEDTVKIAVKGNTNANTNVFILKSYTPVVGDTPDYASGFTAGIELPLGQTITINVGSDAKFICFAQKNAAGTYLVPVKLTYYLV